MTPSLPPLSESLVFSRKVINLPKCCEDPEGEEFIPPYEC